MGRPRLKGARLPNLSTVLTNPKTQWQSVTVKGWYGEGERVVEVVTGTAVWYHTGMSTVAIRWVLIREERRQIRLPVSSMYQSGYHTDTNYRVVCPTLAGGSHL